MPIEIKIKDMIKYACDECGLVLDGAEEKCPHCRQTSREDANSSNS